MTAPSVVQATAASGSQLDRELARNLMSLQLELKESDDRSQYLVPALREAVIWTLVVGIAWVTVACFL